VRIPFKLPFLPEEKVSRDRHGPYPGTAPDRKSGFSPSFLKEKGKNPSPFHAHKKNHLLPGMEEFEKTPLYPFGGITSAGKIPEREVLLNYLLHECRVYFSYTVY
jgi:hypothetical protein